MIGRALFALSGLLPCRLIQEDGRPYLERYFVAKVGPIHVYLHRFVGDDPDRGLHDHPWGWAASLLLAGSYIEQTRAGARRVRWFNFLTGDSFHRVILQRDAQGWPRECWTLFIHGSYAKTWGFWYPVGEEVEEAAVWTRYAYAKPGESSGAARWWKTAPKGCRAERTTL